MTIRSAQHTHARTWKEQGMYTYEQQAEGESAGECVLHLY